jgi:hypothetical protein
MAGMSNGAAGCTHLRASTGGMWAQPANKGIAKPANNACRREIEP